MENYGLTIVQSLFILFWCRCSQFVCAHNRIYQTTTLYLYFNIPLVYALDKWRGKWKKKKKCATRANSLNMDIISSARTQAFEWYFIEIHLIDHITYVYWVYFAIQCYTHFVGNFSFRLSLSASPSQFVGMIYYIPNWTFNASGSIRQLFHTVCLVIYDEHKIATTKKLWQQRQIIVMIVRLLFTFLKKAKFKLDK